MDTLCKEYSLQPIYRKVDGAFLKSQNEKLLECTVTFQTHTILQRFLLRFDYLSLDCNDHLFIYDGSHAVGEYKVSFPSFWKLRKSVEILLSDCHN